MTMPTLIVEIGFTGALTGTALHLDDSARGILGTATLGADNLFEDVTEFVTNVTTRRGATRTNDPVVRYDTGSCTITFRNDDRRFDPTNLSGPYVAGGVTQVEPMRAVRIRAEWNGATYPLWRGFTDQWTVGYDGPNSGWASVTCFDAFGVFAAHDRNAGAALGAGETTSTRMTRILNAISWPTPDRAIVAGEETVQATTLANNTLTELQLTADTELGGLWIDASGRVAFRPRSAPYTLPRSVYPLAHFGDSVQQGDTTINLAANPSLETDTTGWIAGGSVSPTLARSSTRAAFGAWSLLVTWGAGGVLPLVNYDVSGLIVGRTYTISVYVWVPTGSPKVVPIVGGTNHFGDESTLFDQWQRLTWTGVASATTMGYQIWPTAAPTAGQQVWIDGLQAQEGSTASAYIDGDQPVSEWDGVAHASTSRSLPELPYADVDLAYDALSITNHVGAARTGGTEQTAVDSASLSAYLTRSHRRTDLLMQTDAEALIWAEQVVARRALPELRFASVQLKPAGDPRLWPQAFSREIGERVRVTRRPPGGGDPIVRECWVRGIEHTLPADQKWETRFVLEQARDVNTITALFGTAAATGWSPADTGQAWTLTGATAASFAVAGGSGRHIHSATNNFLRCLAELGSTNAQFSCDFVNPSQPTGAPISEWLVARAQDVDNYYTASLSISTGNVVTIALFKRVATALSGLPGASLSIGSTSSGQTWRLILQVAGSLVRAKAWRPGVDSEPGWQVSATDTSLTTGTKVGVLTRCDTGNTNTKPYTIFVDNVAATTLHAWT